MTILLEHSTLYTLGSDGGPTITSPGLWDCEGSYEGWYSTWGALHSRKEWSICKLVFS